MSNFRNLESNEDKEIYRIISTCKQNWEQGEVYITDKVYFKTTDLIKQCRKNYFGVFSKSGGKTEHMQIDEHTGYPKIFVPLTEWTVDTLVKNIDIDTKNIELRATTPVGYGIASIMRLVLREYLRKLRFGETLNNLLRFLAIDGLQTIKSYEGFNEDIDKITLKTDLVDTLNIIIDPSSFNCQKAPAIIEKALYTIDEFQEYGDKWKNVDAVKGRKDLSQNLNVDTFNVNANEIPYVDLYEYWGKLPAWCLNEGKEGDNKWIEAQVIISKI